jgi:hypothetical protein
MGSSALGTTVWFIVHLQGSSRPIDHDPDDDPVIPSLLSNQSDLVKLIESEKLKFHSLKDAGMATRRILELLVREQQSQVCCPRKRVMLCCACCCLFSS